MGPDCLSHPQAPTASPWSTPKSSGSSSNWLTRRLPARIREALLTHLRFLRMAGVSTSPKRITTRWRFLYYHERPPVLVRAMFGTDFSVEFPAIGTRPRSWLLTINCGLCYGKYRASRLY